MTSKEKQKVSTIFYTLLSLYVFVVALLMLSKVLLFWPFIFFALIALFAAYVVYTLYKNKITRTLSWAIAAQTVLATSLLFPTAIASLVDFFGYRCRKAFGVIEQCVNDPIFLSFVGRFWIMFLMIALAAGVYFKSKR